MQANAAEPRFECRAMRTFTDLQGRDEPPLPSWDAPKPGEPAHGFVARLCWQSRRPSVAALLTGYGLNGRDFQPSECLEFAFSFPISGKDALAAATPFVEPNRVEFLGQAVRRRQWHISQRRFCPACLAEDPYHRVWWDLPAFARCPYHELPIECTDPGGHAVPWWSPSFTHSPTGRPLQRFGVPRRAVPLPSLEAYLLGRLGVEPVGPSSLLDGLPFLGDVLDAVELVGRVALGGAMVSRPIVNQTDGFDRATVHRAGYEVLAGGEEALIALLHRVAGERALAGGGRGKTLFGWFNDAVSEEDGDHVALLERAMTRVVVERGDFSRRTESEWANGSSGWVPVPTLAQELGLNVVRLRRLSETLGIHERQFGSARSRYRAFSPEQVDLVRGTLDSLVDRDGAAELLGVSRCTVGSLITAGEIKILMTIGKDQSRDRFRPEDIMAYRDRTLARAKLVASPPAGLVPLRAIRRTCKTDPGKLIRAQLRRTGGPMRVGDSLGDLLVPDPQLGKAAAMAAARAARWIRPGLSRFTAAKLYGDTEAAIDGFIEVGQLKTLPGTGSFRRICPKSLRKVCARWAPGAIYKGLVDASRSGTAARRLAELGATTLELRTYPRVLAVDRASARAVLGLHRDPDDPATGGAVAFVAAFLRALADDASWSLATRSKGLGLRTSKGDFFVSVEVDELRRAVTLTPASARAREMEAPVLHVDASELKQADAWPALIGQVRVALDQMRARCS